MDCDSLGDVERKWDRVVAPIPQPGGSLLATRAYQPSTKAMGCVLLVTLAVISYLGCCQRTARVARDACEDCTPYHAAPEPRSECEMSTLVGNSARSIRARSPAGGQVMRS